VSDPGAAAKKFMDEINAIRFAAKLNDLAQLLSASACVKFGKFTLKSGKSSPIYVDLRRLVTFPAILRGVARHYCDILRHIEFDRLAGLPYAALPIATAVSLEMGKPLIYPRREAKEYGTKAVIEGDYTAGERVVIIDDLISTGETKMEAIEKLEKGAGLKVVAIVVLIDRDMGAKKWLAERGYDFRAAGSLSELLPVWRSLGTISKGQMEEAQDFLSKL
jgi:uridine monophosphate synthetase